MMERATAIKYNISDLKAAEWKGEKAAIRGEEITKVRIVGTVVQKYLSEDGNYGFIVLDDETDSIRIKAFKEDIGTIKKMKKGDFADAIGKIKKYGDEVYISPEIIRRINDPNFYYLRKLETMIPKKQRKMSMEEGKEEILEKIRGLDKGEGASFEDIEKELNMRREDVEAVLYNLLKDGFIYEPRHRRYKVL